MTRRDDIIAKVLARVKLVDCPILPTPCWQWTGPTSGKGYQGAKKGRGHGYPRMYLDGQTCAVHKVVFTHYHGYIPGLRQLDHLCRNRLCVNHEHLELVTHLVNQKRRAIAARKGIA